MLRRLWTEELVTFDGRWHHLDRVGLNPMPVQRPIPIWMGSFRGRVVERVIRRVGRLADGWFPQFPPGDELAAVARPAARLRRRGRPRPGVDRDRGRHRGAPRRRSATVGRPGDGVPRPRRDPPAGDHRRAAASRRRQTTSPPPCAGSTPSAPCADAGARVDRAPAPTAASARSAADRRRGVEADGDHAEPGGVALGGEAGVGVDAGDHAVALARGDDRRQGAVERVALLVDRRRQPVGQREVGRADVGGVDAGHGEDRRRWPRPPGGSRSSGCTPRRRWRCRRSRRRSGSPAPSGPKLRVPSGA